MLHMLGLRKFPHPAPPTQGPPKNFCDSQEAGHFVAIFLDNKISSSTKTAIALVIQPSRNNVLRKTLHIPSKNIFYSQKVV